MSTSTTRTKRPESTSSESLVDEVRRIRDAISRQFDNDVQKLCDHLQSREKANKRRLVYPNHLRKSSKAR